MPESLQVGDIIIEMDGGSADHSLLWVGGDKPIVHSAESEEFVGVIRQSAKPYAVWKSDDKKWKSYARVYRNNDDLGQRAAQFALDWATRSDEQAYVDLRTLGKDEAEKFKSENPRRKRESGGGKNITIGSPKFKGSAVVLDTPFSQARLGGPELDWNVLSLFRALRAYHRAQNRLPLSQLKGVTCSQFITYCYQAAAVQKHFGGAPIPQKILAQISNSDRLYSLKQDGGAADLIHDALKGINVSFMPKGMLVDAKTTSASNLQEKLGEGNSGFTFRGDLAPALKIIQPNEGGGLQTYKDVKKLCEVDIV